MSESETLSEAATEDQEHNSDFEMEIDKKEDNWTNNSTEQGKDKEAGKNKTTQKDTKGPSPKTSLTNSKYLAFPTKNYHGLENKLIELKINYIALDITEDGKRLIVEFVDEMEAKRAMTLIPDGNYTSPEFQNFNDAKKKLNKKQVYISGLPLDKEQAKQIKLFREEITQKIVSKTWTQPKPNETTRSIFITFADEETAAYVAKQALIELTFDHIGCIQRCDNFEKRNLAIFEGRGGSSHK